MHYVKAHAIHATRQESNDWSTNRSLRLHCMSVVFSDMCPFARRQNNRALACVVARLRLYSLYEFQEHAVAGYPEVAAFIAGSRFNVPAQARP